ncbi:MCE family protein [Actinocorallia longicatena]|uniref:MCE family protein n=1 Tax=Actinocorallia longicatena TaxID=111803 RepID=A0ABP6QMX4_9ACTN
MNGRRFAGVAFLLIPPLLIWLSIAIYDKKFTRVAWVTLRVATAGSEMHPQADVKLRGVRVGEVRSISADGGGAKLRLALDPDKLGMVPANVHARLLPTTLFGQRYVSLVLPPDPSADRLKAGGTIGQDNSANAIEIQQLLDTLLPLLQAVEPAKLAATLSAIATALDGRGEQIGATFVKLDAYLKKLNPSLPTLNQGIRELVEFTRNYSVAAPELIDALADVTFTSRTLVDQKKDLATLYTTTTSASQDLTKFLKENSGNIIRLAKDSKPGLTVMAKYSAEFPCVMRMLTDFVPVMDEALGKGTDRPGLRVQVGSVPSKGAYRPGKDTPKYGAKGGPSCYPVPYTTAKVSTKGLGLPNSPQENRLVNELVAPALQEPAQTLPDWSSVLVGPLFRGTKVTVS